MFNRVYVRNRVQLICTTLENALMDRELPSSDEIWFVGQRTSEGSSPYSLDVSGEMRIETPVEKRSWKGRYDGVPALSVAALGGDRDEHLGGG